MNSKRINEIELNLSEGEGKNKGKNRSNPIPNDRNLHGQVKKGPGHRGRNYARVKVPRQPKSFIALIHRNSLIVDFTDGSRGEAKASWSRSSSKCRGTKDRGTKRSTDQKRTKAGKRKGGKRKGWSRDEFTSTA